MQVHIQRIQGDRRVGREVAVDIDGRVCGDRAAAAEVGVAVDRDAAGVDIRVDIDQLTRRQGQGKGAVDRTLQSDIAVVAAENGLTGERQRVLDIDQAIVAIDVAAEQDRIALGVESDAVTAERTVDRDVHRIVGTAAGAIEGKRARRRHFSAGVDGNGAVDVGNGNIAGRAEVASEDDVEGVGDAEVGDIAAGQGHISGGTGRGQCQGVGTVHGTEVNSIRVDDIPVVAVGHDRRIDSQLGQADAGGVEGVDGDRAAAGDGQFGSREHQVAGGSGDVTGEVDGVAGGDRIDAGGGQGDVAVEAGIAVGGDIAAEADRCGGAALGRQLDRAVTGGSRTRGGEGTGAVAAGDDVHIEVRRDGFGRHRVAGRIQRFQGLDGANGAERHAGGG